MDSLTNIICIQHGCGKEAVANINWYSVELGLQTANLCQSHIDEFWKQYHGLVSLGTISFSMGPLVVRSIEEQP
jgi:hypothetical protein